MLCCTSRPATGRRRPLWGACLALLLLTSAGPAAAASVLIDLDFASNSSISLLGGTIVTPPDGSVDTGSGRLSLEATSLTSFVPGGQAEMDQVTFSATVAKNVLGQADVSGTISGTQVGSILGSLNAAQTDVDFLGTIAIDLTASLACTGSGCASLGLPVSTAGVVNLTTGSLPITGLGTVGAAQVAADIPISLGGVLGVLHLVGVETQRSIVPEPTGLVGLGLAAALLAVRRRSAG